MAEEDVAATGEAVGAAMLLVAASGPADPPPAEKRDDLDTVSPPDLESRTVEQDDAEHESGDEVIVEAGFEEAEETDMNATRLDDDDAHDDKLDLHSVISGNDLEGDNKDGEPCVFEDKESDNVGKNLGAIFDDAKEMERMELDLSLKPPPPSPAPAAASAAPGGGPLPRRPPLPPARPATAPPTPGARASGAAAARRAASQGAGGGGGKKRAAAPGEDEDRRLAVYLRLRPPVASGRDGGGGGALDTIEVVEGKGKPGASLLPTAVRTYPPPQSKAAKVVRGNSSAPKRCPSSSKSLVADTPGGPDPSAKVRGVKEYAYSGVFGTAATQREVYDAVAAPLVEGLLSPPGPDDKVPGGELGESALLFTYGVTNAGKTHTVMGAGLGARDGGSGAPHEEWGIIPRAIEHLLGRVRDLNRAAAGEGRPKLLLSMSYLEIYNEKIYDLLPDDEAAAQRRPCDGPPTLKLREGRRGRIFVKGLVRHAVADVRDGLDLARRAKNNRHTASNNINAESSRSHSICQLEITRPPPGSLGGAAEHGAEGTADSEYETDDDSSACSGFSAGSSRRSARDSGLPPKKKSSIIWIVDLAGSERSQQTRIGGRQQKEAALINASLMNLMRCLREMRAHQPATKRRGANGGIVPFRESKLTHLFMNHLTGPAASRTSMIVNVNPAADNYDETQHVLSYAATARSVVVSAVDYNRRWRLQAKEDRGETKPSSEKEQAAPPNKRSILGKVVQKLSPKKRKGMAAPSPLKLHAKRLRSGSSPASASHNGKRLPPAKVDMAKKCVPPRKAPMRPPKTRAFTGKSNEVEQLREKNFSLQITVDDLSKQLTEAETEVRKEVVDTMGEQLQERKDWYEGRIAQLQKQIADLLEEKQALVEQKNDEREFRNECEDEMKRMREDHRAEMDEKALADLQLIKEQEATLESLKKEHARLLLEEQSKRQQLEEEAGTLRHQLRELQAGHDELLARNNALLKKQSQLTEDMSPVVAAPGLDNENSASSANKQHILQLTSPSSRRLPGERLSAVASIADHTNNSGSSKKKKKGIGWFSKSPKKAKLAMGSGSKKSAPVRPQPSPTRSPLGDINRR